MDGAELKKLRFKFLNKVTGKVFNTKNSKILQKAVVICKDAAHSVELCLKDLLNEESGVPFLLAQEMRVANIRQIFGTERNKARLKSECQLDKVKFYELSKTAETRWIASRVNSYENCFATFPQQIELFLSKKYFPKTSQKQKT